MVTPWQFLLRQLAQFIAELHESRKGGRRRCMGLRLASISSSVASLRLADFREDWAFAFAPALPCVGSAITGPVHPSLVCGLHALSFMPLLHELSLLRDRASSQAQHIRTMACPCRKRDCVQMFSSEVA